MVIYQFTYPVTLTVDDEDGGYVVTCRDLPEAITQGDSVEECIIEAADCLEESLAGRIRRNDSIPMPSACMEGEYPVNVPIQTTMKAALYLAMKEKGITRIDLAPLLHVDERELNCLLDPQYSIELHIMERALSVLSGRAELRVVQQHG